VHRTATDARAREARFDRTSGRFTLPPRTAVVFVLPNPPTALPPLVTTTLPATLATPEDLQLDIQLPPGYDAQRGTRYPVLYLDDGQDLESVRVRESLAAGYADGTLRPLILVAMHMPKDRMGAYGLSDRVAKASVIGPTKYGPVGTQAYAYSEWVAKTLVPWIDAQYRTQATPAGRAVLGWSLGGLNALNIGWEYPEVFGTAGAFSPSFWISAESGDAVVVQRTRLAQQKVEAGPPRPNLRAFFAVGTSEEKDDRDGDGTIDVLDDTRDLIAALVRQGATFDADSAKPGNDLALYVLPGGQHRQDSWAKMFPVFLQWAYGRPAHSQ
jgi:enterochelin esterase-like enzyme